MARRSPVQWSDALRSLPGPRQAAQLQPLGQQQGAKPEFQGAEHDPAQGPAASQPLLGVMSPPVSQNRARKVIRRPVLRPATVRARATSPRSAISHQ